MSTNGLRLEKAIRELKPAPINIDPTKNFWTVYNQVADEHDNDLLKKYSGDLDTSLLFVSALMSLARLVLNPVLSCIGGFVLCRRHNFHCPNPSIAKYRLHL
jgi:hypothetical protein